MSPSPSAEQALASWRQQLIPRHLLTGLLRRDTFAVAACLLLVIILSWSYLLHGAGTLEDMGGMLMPMSSGPWTAHHTLLMLAMWSVMMAAMMLPGAAPMILFYGLVARGRRDRGERVGAPSMFALGYALVWAVFSLGAVALQYVLEAAALLSPMMEATSIVMAGSVLILAGLYQWTPWKNACLRQCASPLEFVLFHWREGHAGAWHMGLRHGMYCVGCCWVLMLLLFAGGVMNLVWIAGLALFVMLEKIAPARRWVSRGAGLVLIAWGVFTLLAAR